MKKTIGKCFSIILFTITIVSMISVFVSEVGEKLFAFFGIVCISLLALTLIVIWVACVSILLSATKETIKTGEGISKLFQKFLGKLLTN